MPNEVTQEVVVNYALEKPQNLEIACAVGASFEEIQNRAILKFTEQLKTALRDILIVDWILRNDMRSISRRTPPVFALDKPSWGTEGAIGLYNEVGGSKVYIGVSKEREPSLTDTDENALRDNLKAEYPNLQWNAGWAAWWYFKGPYSDWSFGNPRALVDMYFHTEKVIEDFKPHILRWAALFSTVVDKPRQT